MHSLFKDGQELPLTDAVRAEILAANKAMADQALRVLCAARRSYAALPADLTPAALEQELTFLGLAGMIDPIRPEVKAAIEECRTAGIRPVMITGDHRDTAVAIESNLAYSRTNARLLPELSSMTSATRNSAARSTITAYMPACSPNTKYALLMLGVSMAASQP